MNTVPDSEAVESLMAALRGNVADSRLWLKLCLTLAPTEPMGALAAAQRALDTCDYELLAHPTDDLLGYRATRRQMRLPIRGILIELLLQAGYKAAASVHFHIYRENLLKTPELVVPIPTPRLAYWLESPGLAHANDVSDTPDKHHAALVVAAQLRVYSWRMLLTEVAQQVPAVVVSRKYDRVKLALLVPGHPIEAQCVVRASRLAFPSLATVAAGTPMQLLVGRLGAHGLPRVLGVAARPTGTVWEQTVLRSGVVFWVMPAQVGVRTLKEAGAVVVLGPTAYDRIWVPMIKFAKSQIIPRVGDALTLRLLKDRESYFKNPVILTLEIAAVPDPAVWQAFHGELVIETPELGFVQNTFRIYSSLVLGKNWRSGQSVSGIAVPMEDTLNNRILWQAIRVEAEAEADLD